MVDYSDIRSTSPTIAFFFACMGAFIGFSSEDCPQVRDFTLGDSSLSLVLGDLYPLLCQSLDWFGSVREVLRRENMGSEVRSSDLETSRHLVPAWMGLRWIQLLPYLRLPFLPFLPLLDCSMSLK